MKAPQVMLVGLEHFLEDIERWLAGADATLHVVDDLDDAADLLGVTGASLLLVNRRLAGLDAVEVVARCHGRSGDEHAPFVFLDPAGAERPLVVRRRPEDGEFSVEEWPRGQVGPLLRATVSPRSEPPPPCPVATPRVRERLLEIGFNGKAEHDGRLLVVQTEIFIEDAGSDGARVAIRVTVFERGRLLWARMHPVMLGSDPVAELEARADEIHRRVIEQFNAHGTGR